VDLVALFSAIASIFVGGTVTPDTNSVLKVGTA
jgi:hypothetical protein